MKSQSQAFRWHRSIKAKGRWIISSLVLMLLSMVKLPDTAAVTIKVGYPQLSGAQMPLWVIIEARIDRQYGVDLKAIYIPGGARLTQTLVSGDVDVAITGGAAVNAMLSGADIIYVGMPVPTYAFSLYVRSDIKEVTDLRGKVLAVITKGASSDHASIALLRQYKMSQGKDVKVLYFSRQPDALAALNQGIVSAAILSSPTTVTARRLGFKELINIAALKVPYPHNAVAIRRSLVRQNPELVKSFLKTYVVAIKIIHEEPEAAKRALAHSLAIKDTEIIEETYRTLAPLFPKIPYMTEEAIRSVLSVSDHPRAATADPKDFFDSHFLKELEDTGFVKELYSR